jgi:hypothetical protein
MLFKDTQNGRTGTRKNVFYAKIWVNGPAKKWVNPQKCGAFLMSGVWWRMRTTDVVRPIAQQLATSATREARRGETALRLIRCFRSARQVKH